MIYLEQGSQLGMLRGEKSEDATVHDTSVGVPPSTGQGLSRAQIQPKRRRRRRRR